jgi:hypothetical protein
MRQQRLFTCALVLLLVALTLCGSGAARADSRLQSYVAAGGGGESSGGNFRLHGTIGQPAVALLSGGGFALQGGFWYAEVPPLQRYPLYLPLLLKQ